MNPYTGAVLGEGARRVRNGRRWNARDGAAPAAALRMAAMYNSSDVPGRAHDNGWGVAPSVSFGMLLRRWAHL